MKTRRLLMLMVMLVSAVGCATCCQQANYSASDQHEQKEPKYPFWEWFINQIARNLIGFDFCYSPECESETGNGHDANQFYRRKLTSI